MKALIFGLTIILLSSFSTMAVNPDEVLDDPLLEKRARALSVNIRCLVCQHQSLDASNADLARAVQDRGSHAHLVRPY